MDWPLLALKGGVALLITPRSADGCVMLLSIYGDGIIAPTFHPSLDHAKRQAIQDFGGDVTVWQPVHLGYDDAIAFAKEQIA